MIRAQTTSLIEQPDGMGDRWCVYEHWCGSGDAALPPMVVYVGACRLRDVYNLTDARNNSEWVKLFERTGREIMVNIVATTNDRREAMNRSVSHARSFAAMPRCNLYGRTLFGNERALVCSNGQEYANQSEAARIIGCSQSAISENLAGKRRAVKGLIFSYKD